MKTYTRPNFVRLRKPETDEAFALLFAVAVLAIVILAAFSLSTIVSGDGLEYWYLPLLAVASAVVAACTVLTVANIAFTKKTRSRNEIYYSELDNYLKSNYDISLTKPQLRALFHKNSVCLLKTETIKETLSISPESNTPTVSTIGREVVEVLESKLPTVNSKKADDNAAILPTQLFS